MLTRSIGVGRPVVTAENRTLLLAVDRSRIDTSSHRETAVSSTIFRKMIAVFCNWILLL